MGAPRCYFKISDISRLEDQFRSSHCRAKIERLILETDGLTTRGGGIGEVEVEEDYQVTMRANAINDNFLYQIKEF